MCCIDRNYSVISGENSLLQIFVFNKLNDMNTNELSSGMARVNVLTECLNALALNPVIGVGMNDTYNMINKFDNVGGGKFAVLIASTGIPYMIFLLYPYIKRAFDKGRNIVQFILYIVLFLNTALSQSRELYPALMIIPIIINYYTSVEMDESYENLWQGAKMKDVLFRCIRYFSS